MENIVLVVHLILALSLIGIVLLQRSEGGGLGMGGGGGNGANTGRSMATALGKMTWYLAAGFIATSIALTVIAAQKSGQGSVLDRVGGSAPAPVETPANGLGEGDLLLPPSDGDASLTPPPAE